MTPAESLPIRACNSTYKTNLLAAFNRFFHSPLKQKHPRRLPRQAIALVRRDFE